MTPPKIERLRALIAEAEAHEYQSLDSQNKRSNTQLEVGRALIQIKNSLPHGQWQKWHDENIRCKLRTTQKWMRLAALEDKPTPSKAPTRSRRTQPQRIADSVVSDAEIRELAEMITDADAHLNDSVSKAVARINACAALGKKLSDLQFRLGRKWINWIECTLSTLPDAPASVQTCRKWMRLASYKDAKRLTSNGREVTRAYKLADLIPEVEATPRIQHRGRLHIHHLTRAKFSTALYVDSKLTAEERSHLKKLLQPLADIHSKL